jgi:enterochelin esterase family protein
MEYLFEIEDQNEHRATITDPDNPRRVPGAFGDKSVVEFAEYTPPTWLDAPAETGSVVPFEIEAPRLESTVTGALWTPVDVTETDAVPLVVVHDGPEFDALAGFTNYIAAMIAEQSLPPMRVALLSPGERNNWYSANPDYAATLAEVVLPSLPSSAARIGVGASLGALAVLHAQETCGAPFDALFLQSGSFFTPELDPQESGFSGFGAVTTFVAGVNGARRTADRAVPVGMTCGVPEENLANNEAMAATLRRLGHPVALTQVRDAHNYTAWRDAWQPNLTELITTTVATHAA